MHSKNGSVSNIFSCSFCFCCTVSTDFEVLDSQILSGGKVQFFTTNDEITLEYDDRVLLTYTPDIENLAMQLEQQTPPEFLRSTAIVQIEDDDREKISFSLASCQFTNT